MAEAPPPEAHRQGPLSDPSAANALDHHHYHHHHHLEHYCPFYQRATTRAWRAWPPHWSASASMTTAWAAVSS